jgi:PhoH-like ATPase
MVIPMRKHFVLDTNVLLHDPLAIFRFADNFVVIPIYVLEEIDQFKKELSERGRNAREVCRRLDEFRESGRHLSDGIALPNGGHLRVALGAREVPAALRAAQIADNLILGVGLQVRDTNPDTQVILVTKDVNLRIRADAMGLNAEDYDVERINIEELYSGHAELQVPGAAIDTFYKDGRVEVEALDLGAAASGLHANQYLLLRARDGGSQTALGRLEARNGHQAVLPVSRLKQGVWGIRPKNKEQHYALDLLLNDEIKLVTLVGKAGTGKTLLAIAAGLQKVVEDKTYQKLLVSRPIFPLGRDIGYLPGTMEEKLNPWMQPIYDNVELLLGLSKAERKEGRSHEELINLGYMEIEALTYIRGRSIPNQFMIVDEAQNLTPHEVKTILTRVGDNTKIVLTGDPYQIDNPYVDATNNGLTTVAERFKGESLAGHITLVKGERSSLAELASNIL